MLLARSGSSMSGCINPPQNCTSMSWKQTDFCLKLHKTFFFSQFAEVQRGIREDSCVSVSFTWDILKEFQHVPNYPLRMAFTAKDYLVFCAKERTHICMLGIYRYLQPDERSSIKWEDVQWKMYHCMTTSDGLSLSSGQMKHPRRWSHYKSLWNCCCCWWWWWCLYFSEMVYTTWFNSVIVKNVITHEIKFMLLE